MMVELALVLALVAVALNIIHFSLHSSSHIYQSSTLYPEDVVLQRCEMRNGFR